MSETKFYVKQGLVQKAKGKILGGFDLNRFFKWAAGKYNIPYIDECCDTEATAFPVRFNTSGTDKIEYFNGTAWVIAPSGTVSSDVITETTAGSGVTVDGVLLKDGGVSANSMIAGFFPTVAAQALSGAGAVNVTSYLTKFTSTGAAQALTIASGTQIGQRKKVSHVVDGGSGVLTGVFVGGTTITFTTVGEFADLIWDGSSWAVLELGNTATPGTPPVLA
jgi:hypothetical protein